MVARGFLRAFGFIAVVAPASAFVPKSFGVKKVCSVFGRDFLVVGIFWIRNMMSRHDLVTPY